MALLDEVRSVVRVAPGTDAFDVELTAIIEAAKADMVRVGIDPDYIESDAPLVKQAIFCFAKSRFGYDNPDAPRFETAYRQTVTDILHSAHNLSAVDDD